MLLGERQRRRLIRCHHVEVQKPLRAFHPRIEDMNCVGLGLSHRKVPSFVVRQKVSCAIGLTMFLGSYSYETDDSVNAAVE